MPKRVLIADDNESVRRVIRSVIEDVESDIQVCALTADGVETVDTAIALRPDLVILDLQMPGLNGIEVAAALKSSLPNTRTILFTMYADVCRRIAPSVGANALIDKVEGLPALVRSVQWLLGQRLGREFCASSPRRRSWPRAVGIADESVLCTFDPLQSRSQVPVGQPTIRQLVA